MTYLLLFLMTAIVPVADEARIVPLSTYTEKTLEAFTVPDATKQDWLFRFATEGTQSYRSTPLFFISHPSLLKDLKLSSPQTFSYNELHAKITPEFLAPLIIEAYKKETPLLKNFKTKESGNSLYIQKVPENSLWSRLKGKSISLDLSLNTNREREKWITALHQFELWNRTPPHTPPTRETLIATSPLLKVLPSKWDKREWLPIASLHLSNTNFTAYSDATFSRLKKHSHDWNQLQRILSSHSPVSPFLLYSEEILTQYPLTLLCALLYLLAALFPKKPLFLTAFLLHTALIALRCIVLGRPPITNMHETALYVPWIIIILSYAFGWLRIGVIPTALLLLALVWTGADRQLDVAQAVLNSRYWLIVHVMMVVASYGAFILAGILSHVYLIRPQLTALPRSILHSIYIGAALLIPGTILGGVWAAESWGRFWDWDPKESWAFISCGVYLLIIHAYRYNRIADKGLALAAIVGMLVISFTWYGVNYILGTGLHSYGFGSGGEVYYAAFIAAELLFLTQQIRGLK